MTERTAEIVFAGVWWTLLAVAGVAVIATAGRPAKARGSRGAGLLVATPFVLILGLAWLARWVGTFDAGPALRAAGAVLALAGLAGYLLSHVWLRANWSLGASVREGQELVAHGPYRVVRHPMYSSMTLVVFGSGLLVGDYLMLAATALVGAAYFVRARAEERLLVRELPGYADYARRVKMFVPYVV